MQANNPYEITDIVSTITALQRRYRDSRALSRLAPLMRSGGHEARVGNSAYIPKSYRYKYNTFGRNLNLNEFMAVKLNEIKDDPLGIEHFGNTYRQKYIYNQPRPGSLKRASIYQKSGAVMDIDSLESGESLVDWRTRVTSQGIPVSVEDIDQRIFLTKNEADLMPWAGSSQTVRKRTTLLNYNVMGSSKSMSGAATFGMETPYVTTPQMIDLSRKQSEAYLYKVKNAHVMDRADQMLSGLSNYGQARMVQYSTMSRLQGGPFLFKEGLFKGQSAFPEKRISLDPTELKALRKFGTTSYINWQNASIKSTRAQRVAMLADMGISKTRGRRIADLLDAMNRGDILSSRAIGKQREFIYGAREDFGQGSKAVIGGAKGLMAEVKTYGGKNKYSMRSKYTGGFTDIAKEAMAEWDNPQFALKAAAMQQTGGDFTKAQALYKKAMKNPDVIAPILTGKETLRHLDRLMEGATLNLTHSSFQKDPQAAMANAQRIAEIINMHAKESVASTTERTLNLTHSVSITQPMVEDVMNLLSPIQKAQMNMGRMPAMVYSIGNASRVKYGKHIGITVNDIMGLQIQGMPGIANLYGGKIAKNQWSIASEIQSAYGHLSGRLEGIKGAMSVGGSDIGRLMGRTTIRGGKTLHNVQGSLLFDPSAIDQTYMLNLGRKVKVDIGGMDREISEIPLLSKGARGLKMDSSGQIYKTQLDRSYLNLLEAIKSGTGIESAAQGVVSTMGTFGGKKGFVDRAVAMTKVEGLSGTMHFISPEAEAALTAKYGQHGGFVGITMEQAKKIYGEASEQRIQQMFDEGVYLPLKREPAAPRGTAVGRGFIINDELKQMANFGKNGIAISPAIGAHVHGDLDNDTAFVITEWAKQAESNPELKAMFKAGYQQDLHRFMGFENDVVNKLRKNNQYSNYIEDVQSRLSPEANLGEVAAIAQAKKELTGKAYIKGAQAYHGAMALGNLPGYSRFTQQRAADVSQVLFGIAESGINAKRGGKVLQADELEEMIRSKDVSGFTEGSRDVMSSIFGEDLPEHERLSLSADAIEATSYGASKLEGYNKYRKLISGSSEYRSSGVSQIADALFMGHGTGETPMGEMIGAGIFKSAEQLGSQNTRLAAEAAIPRSKGFVNAVREGAGSFLNGLREGRGWTSLAAGAAILGGIALGMRKPGVINVSTNSQESQVTPDGTYLKTNEMKPSTAPMIMPRRQTSLPVMTDEQYSVKIKLRDARKKDREQIVDLSKAISGRYRNSSKVQLTLKDDTNDVDYQRIFDDQYRKALIQGRS